MEVRLEKNAIQEALVLPWIMLLAFQMDAKCSAGESGVAGSPLD